MGISKEKCLEKISNAYVLTIIAAKRARQLNQISKEKNIHQLKELSLVNSESTGAGEIALEEIAAGKINFHFKED